jgi:hypothetical protein
VIINVICVLITIASCVITFIATNKLEKAEKEIKELKRRFNNERNY